MNEKQKIARFTDEVAQFFDDPLGFVYWAFPWKQNGTSLAAEDGPEDWQAEILSAIGDEVKHRVFDAKGAIQVAVASGHGVGKQLKYNEKIQTPHGEIEIQHLAVGDQVLGSDGKPHRIIGFFPQGQKRLYRVQFSDGSSVLAGAEHQWQVMARVDRDRDRPPRVLTTEQIARHLKRKYQIPMCAPAEFERRTLKIDPYVMGYLIANGSFCTESAIKVCCYDEELFAEFDKRLPLGYSCNGKERNGRYRHISQPTGRYVGVNNPIWAALVHYGLDHTKSPEKFIPEDYLLTSSEDRIELLRGLMDGDGCISERKGRPNGYRCVFSTSSQKLRDQIIWLVQSLGGVAGWCADDRRGQHDAKFNITTQHINYQVSINTPNSINPFHVARKRELYETWASTTKREPIRVIKSIEFEEEAEAYCISVDAPDWLYLTSNFIVTHNSALVSWLILWFMSTRAYPNIVVTANTQPQLAGKTWRELRKWWRLSITGHWFVWTATKFYLEGDPGEWFATAYPWSKEKPEAFAGTHADSVMLIMDEASAIEDIIWTNAEGAMTDKEAVWICFGNPTRNTGRFRQCWSKFRHRWITRQVDSRTVRRTNKVQLDQWVEDYGEDSDFVRIRVRGVFPRAGTNQLIPSDLVEEAQNRMPEHYEEQPIIIGVDVAQYGDNQTVFLVRQGVAILSIDRYRGMSTMDTAALIARKIKEIDPDATILEQGGVGAGVCDWLVKHNWDVTPVYTGGRPLDKRTYYNMRSEMWGNIVDWLKAGGCLPRDDQELADDLIGPEYGFDHLNRIQLEKKKDMKARGLASPDSGDALALTLAVPISLKRPRKSKEINPRMPTWDEMIREYEQGLPDPEDYRI